IRSRSRARPGWQHLPRRAPVSDTSNGEAGSGPACAREASMRLPAPLPCGWLRCFPRRGRRAGGRPALRAGPRARVDARGVASKNGLELSHPDRVVYPEPGYTKADVAAHALRVADVLLPALRDRPLN